MATISQLENKVKELINDGLVPALIEAGIDQHKKHAFKTNCCCKWCENKRAATRGFNLGYYQDEGGELKKRCPRWYDVTLPAFTFEPRTLGSD